ncbi:MAG: cytosine permease, partial [Treponema sp.]|nr:cytosine permease [Treponema sp.]
FADFFFVRRQQIDLRAAYGMKGHEGVYRFTKGVNLVGMAAVVFGVAVSLAIYNPVTCDVHIPFLFYLTPTGASFLATMIFYTGLSFVPAIRKYMAGKNPLLSA